VALKSQREGLFHGERNKRPENSPYSVSKYCPCRIQPVERTISIPLKTKSKQPDVADSAAAYSDGAVLWRLLLLCWEQRRLCLQVLSSQVVLLVFGLAGLSLTGLGFDYLRFVLEPGAPAPKWPLGWAPPSGATPMKVVWIVAAGVIGFAILRGALTWLSGRLLARLVHRNVVAGLQNAVFAKLQNMHFGYFDQLSRGAIINRATGDIQSIRTFVDTILIQALVTFISLGVYVVHMVSIHALLTVACLSTVPAIWFVCARFSKVVYPHYQQTRVLFDRMILTLAESVEGVGVIKGFARDNDAIERFRKHNQQVKDQQETIFKHVSVFTPTVNFLTHLNMVILLLYGGWLVMHGRLPLGTGLVVFAGLLQLLTNQGERHCPDRKWRSGKFERCPARF